MPDRFPPHDVGIVAIGRNEGDRLRACLASVGAYASNTVYVDSGSTDGSTKAAELLGVSVLNLDLGKPFTAARARNAGFAALERLRPGIEYVQFIDGDCTLVAAWLQTALPFITAHEDVAVVCGRRRERNPEVSILNRLADIEWDTPVGEAFACGGDSLIRSKAFRAVGGFRSQSIAGEEPELCLRLREAGWKVWRLDAEMTRHDINMRRMGQWWARTVRAGYAFAEVSWLHRHSTFRIWRRETIRAVLWGGVLPAAIILCAFLSPVVLVGLLAYPLQVCRIAARRGVRSGGSWAFALFATLAKFAEFQGVMKYYRRRLFRNDLKLIEYK
jgi:GT2 family glycosyltransferase